MSDFNKQLNRSLATGTKMGKYIFVWFTVIPIISLSEGWFQHVIEEMAEEYRNFKPSLVLKYFQLVHKCSIYLYRNIQEAKASDLISEIHLIHLVLVIWWTAVSLANIHFHFSVAISQLGSQFVWYSISHGNSLRVDNTVVALTVILLNFSIQRENTTTLELLITVDNNWYIANYAVKTENIW